MMPKKSGQLERPTERLGKTRNPTKPIASSSPETTSNPKPLRVPVVGIGASAGGLEAFRELLEALPSDTGMAFVLVTHLSKTYKSMLSELLSKATKMPVAEIAGETPVQPNHIYVIPPNAVLTMVDGRVSLTRPQGELRQPGVIDTFFLSLAQDLKSQAIGVVLSGTGRDGTLGLAAIKAEGGIAFAQDQGSAQYGDMPRSASAQFGLSDFVLPPKQIALELARIAGHHYVRSATPEEAEPESRFAGIFRCVKRVTGVDFAQYKPATIQRRILRRMALHNMEDAPAYLKRLQADRAEVDALYQDLLINVTSFFRDPATFEYLQNHVLPEILKNHRGNLPVRVWVPGCATGEEAYSIAMLLTEALEQSRATQVQIFATDISKPAIQTAREGRYAQTLTADISAGRLGRFFVKSDRIYQVVKPIRDLCVFALQDVAKDPPFSKMDLIVCRNLLIYLGVPLQKKVLAVFHYALKPNGYLMLGTSEAVEAASGMFRQVDKKHKLFSKLPSSTLPPFDFVRVEKVEEMVGGRSHTFAVSSATDLTAEADQIVLSTFSPPGVVINSSFEILQFRGHTGPFLQPPIGQATLNLFKMAREGLALDLRAALHRAKQLGGPVRKAGVRVESGSGIKKVTLQVIPIVDKSAVDSAGGSSKDPSYLVLFDANERTSGVKAPAGKRSGKTKSSAAEREMAALRGELTGTQEDLRSIIEEQDATNEELRAANEEILSSNEELQSTNEELETSKEELQASNEELQTVNDELQQRTMSLAEAEERYHQLFELSPLPMWVRQPHGGFLAVNAAARELYGYTESEFLAMPFEKLVPGGEASQPVEDSGKPLLERHVRKSGPPIYAEVRSREIQFGSKPAWLVLATDISERTALEEQLRQSQKMEAIGRLAGGIAHDFNNLLTVILGYASAAQKKLDAKSPVHRLLSEIQGSAEYAAALTGQLLAFSRKQLVEHRMLDLNQAVRGMKEILNRLLGEDIVLALKISTEPCPVKADLGQLSQVIMNLAVNARDAMPKGGCLTIETKTMLRKSEDMGKWKVRPPGRYCLLIVSDNGAGMDADIQSHIFEPFFTTKEVGKGTGLGLSTVYGIVAQHDGWIDVDSEPGRGAAFRIYFPASEGILQGKAPAGGVSRGQASGTILLVEDQAALRLMGEALLMEAGYRVLSAASGRAALELAEKYAGPIDMLVTDVVMPEMNGPELAGHLSRTRPGLMVLYVSGYTDHAMLQGGGIESGTAFLQKPFLLDALRTKVDELLRARNISKG